MPAPKRKASTEPVNEPAKQADDNGIYLDPKLAELRDEEAKKLAAILVEPRSEPTIDDELVKAREAEIKRGDKKLF